MIFFHEEACEIKCKICGQHPCIYLAIACSKREHICDDCLLSLKGQWLVYIVKCSDLTLYTGATNNLDNRIKKHNAGKGAKYTKVRRPVELVRFFICDSKSEALKLEFKIKQLSRNEKLTYQI